MSHARTYWLLAFAVIFGAAGAHTGPKMTVSASGGYQIHLRVDPVFHERYGLSYPVTYVIGIPPASGTLTGQVRHDTSAAWTDLPERGSVDLFNGIDAVRFDRSANLAYVSAALSHTSDDLFIRIIDGSGEPVPVTYREVARYYDNRTAAVVVSADDWKAMTDTLFIRMASILRSYHLPMTAAVITGDCDDSTYAHIQAEIDRGDVEAATHTRTHPRWPYDNVMDEVGGSRSDLLDNLVYPRQYSKGPNEYVYSFIVTYGESSEEIEEAVTQSGYLNARIVGGQTGSYAAWDQERQRFVSDGTTKEMGPPWGTTDPGELNAAFDQRYTHGRIYHLLLHPYTLAPTDEWSKPYFTEHLSHISNRTDVWYTTFGHLYVYRLLGDTSIGQTILPGSPPLVTVQPGDRLAMEGDTTAFTVLATGSLPMTYQWQRDGADIPGATGASYTTPVLTLADSGASFRCIVANDHGADTSDAAVLHVLTPPPDAGIVSDDFNATTLNTSLWTLVDPAGDVTVSTTGGGTEDARLAITIPAGTTHDLWTGNTTAPRIVQAVSDIDFEIEVRFESAMTASIQTQGIYIEQDSAHFIRFDVVYDAPVLSFFAATFSGDDAPVVRQDLPIEAGGPVHIRVRRTGDGWTGWYSTDGVAWSPGAAFDLPFVVRHVGLWAGTAGTSAPGFTCLVDYVQNTASPITDEDGPDMRIPAMVSLGPVSATVAVGDTALFTVSATGTIPISYRWQRDGVDIAEARDSVYSSGPVTAADSGATFRCIVRNAAGADTSGVATLTVVPPAPPPDAALCVRVFLQGAVAGDTMRTDLRRAHLLPLTQPYGGAPWVYEGGENVDSLPLQVVDWVLLELRSGTAETTMVARRAALLLNTGEVVDTSLIPPVAFPGITAGSYHVVVRHRNHLAVMSALPVACMEDSAALDLTASLAAAYGTQPMQALGPAGTGPYAMFAGDGNASGVINATDRNLVWRIQNGLVGGYFSGDFNLSGVVNATDRNLYWRLNNGILGWVP